MDKGTSPGSPKGSAESAQRKACPKLPSPTSHSAWGRSTSAKFGGFLSAPIGQRSTSPGISTNRFLSTSKAAPTASAPAAMPGRGCPQCPSALHPVSRFLLSSRSTMVKRTSPPRTSPSCRRKSCAKGRNRNRTRRPGQRLRLDFPRTTGERNSTIRPRLLSPVHRRRKSFSPPTQPSGRQHEQPARWPRVRQ